MPRRGIGRRFAQGRGMKSTRDRRTFVAALIVGTVVAGLQVPAYGQANCRQSPDGTLYAVSEAGQQQVVRLPRIRNKP